MEENDNREKNSLLKKSKPSSSSKTAPQSTLFNWLWWVLLLAAFGGGCLLIWLFSIPYAQAHAAVSWLSPNRRLDSFTIEIFSQLQPIGWVLAGLLLAAGMGLLVFQIRTRQILARFLTWQVRQMRRLPRDGARLWQDYRPHRAGWLYLTVVVVLMIAAVLVRLLFLNYPMRYDESYTVVVFGMRPWLNLISDYSLPNNHIFHTVLVKLAMNQFGTAPWAVRLPAFISGILCVPAGYLLARQIYGRLSAVLSAGLIAALPMLISYSTNARGYSQYTLFSLILFSLAIYLSKHANLAGWGLFVIIATAGFYTVPFMLFPFGAACLWLAASTAAGETRLVYGSLFGLLKYLFSVGILTVLLTGIVYLPVIVIGTGLDSLMSNPFVTPLSYADFWLSLGEQLNNTWMNWNFDVPLVVQVLLAAGVFLSLVFHRRVSRVKIPLQIAILIWILVVLVLLRRNPLDRIWLFLMPFWLMWACGGLIAPHNHSRLAWRRLQLGLVVGSLVVSASWSYQRVHTYFPGWQADAGKVESAAEYLSQNLVPGDAVAVIFPYDAPYWYYLGRLGVADEFMHRIELETHKRVFAVVTKQYAESPAVVLEAHDLSPEAYQADAAELVYKNNDQEIYLCLHR